MFKFKTIVHFFTAFILACLYAHKFENIFPLKEMVVLVFGVGLTAEIASFILWLLFFWALISLVVNFFVFIFGGGAMRFSGTKIFRVTQGLFFEGFMILLIFLAVWLCWSATGAAAKQPDIYPYWERVGATFDMYGRRILTISIFIWLIIRVNFKDGFSKVYTVIMRFMDEGRMGFGGSARFASMPEEWGREYEKGALYMGRSLYNPFLEIGLKDDAHMMTVAASRTGKGATSIIPNLLLWEGSAVVIDPKGTNAHVTAQARRDMGQTVHIIDPFGIVTKKSTCFNPLQGLEPDDPLIRERIASIADALVIPDEHAKDSHWDDGARTMIAGLIAHVVSQKHKKKPYLHMVRDLINQSPEDQAILWGRMAQNTDAGGAAKDAANRFLRGDTTAEMASIMSSVDKHTEWLSSDIMRNILKKPDIHSDIISLKSLKKTPTTIYLVIPPRKLQQHNRLLRLFVNLMIDAMEDGGRSRVPVLMILDEFLALGKMKEITDAFATMASYNLILWPFIQDLGRLFQLYGKSANALLANSRAVQVFGASDEETKRYISKRLGNRPLSSLARVLHSNDNLPLRSEDDIETDLSKEHARQYIIEAGKPPMLLEKVSYFNSGVLGLDGRFAGKYSRDPDH